MIKVEVVFASLSKQALIPLKIVAGSTVESAIHQSNILKQFPEIDLTKNKIGVFSKKVSLDTVLQDGDRIEIYRPLLIDPKTARRKRAAS